MKETRLFVIQAMPPLHVGAGRGLGHVDNPIVREKITGYPYIPGSAVKGILADRWNASDDRRNKENDLALAFGRKGTTENDSRAGALVFTDARLLFLPVRSFYGTFALVTSPLALNRFKRDLESMGEKFPLPELTFTDGEAAVTGDSVLKEKESGNILFEDLDFKPAPPPVEQLAKTLAQRLFGEEKTTFTRRFAVVSDDVFAFLSETGSEVNAHIRIDDETKTVAKGALWYAETLPAETILYGVAGCDSIGGAKGHEGEIVAKYCGADVNYLQFGGNASTGKGRCFCRFIKPGQNEGKGGN